MRIASLALAVGVSAALATLLVADRGGPAVAEGDRPAGPVAPPAPPSPPSAPSAPTPAKPRDISAKLAAIVKKHDVPGLVACQIDGLTVTAIGAAGVRARGRPDALLATDRMHLGTCTKAMTAVLCATFVREKKLSWGMTLRKAFPDRVQSMKEGWRGVTLQSLLQHRSGAPANVGSDAQWAPLIRMLGKPLRETRSMLLDCATSVEPLSKPGDAFLYSNLGYTIAGTITESVGDDAWESLIAKRVFVPLGMKDTGFGAPATRAMPDRVRGHSAAGQPVPIGPGDDNIAEIGPAGTAHMPIESWARFAACVNRRGRGFGKEFEELDWTSLLTPPAGGDYAMGWAVGTRPWARSRAEGDRYGRGAVLTHSGSNTMWYCVAWLAPERDMALLACTNIAGPGGEAACDAAVASLID